MIQNKVNFSLYQILQLERSDLDLLIFKRQCLLQDETWSKYKFMQFKVKCYRCNGKDNELIQMIDQSNLMLTSEILENNKFLGMVNATVSHEMRNPLNSIISQNEGTRYNHKILGKILGQMKESGKKTLMKYASDISKVFA